MHSAPFFIPTCSPSLSFWFTRLRASPYYSPHLCSHHLYHSLGPRPFIPDLKLTCFTNPFLQFFLVPFGLPSRQIVSYRNSGHSNTKTSQPLNLTIEWRGGLVVNALDQRPRGRGFESAGCGLSRSNRGPVALCTLGLLNPPSSRGR